MSVLIATHIQCLNKLARELSGDCSPVRLLAFVVFINRAVLTLLITDYMIIVCISDGESSIT